MSFFFFDGGVGWYYWRFERCKFVFWFRDDVHIDVVCLFCDLCYFLVDAVDVYL